MGWHDATIHGLAFGPGEFELSLDIDYIFKWVHPAEGEGYFSFWVAPCTLVVQNVYDLHLDAELDNISLVEIADVYRTDPRKPSNADFIGRDTDWQWTIDCHDGKISFRSVGFKRYVRRSPVLTKSQTLDLSERGGFSFERRYGTEIRLNGVDKRWIRTADGEWIIESLAKSDKKPWWKFW